MSGSKMGKETSISNEVIRDFKYISYPLEQKYNFKIQLVQITGRKQVYLAGSTLKAHLCYAKSIPLSDKLGLMVYYEKDLPIKPEEIRKLFIVLIKK